MKIPIRLIKTEVGFFVEIKYPHQKKFVTSRLLPKHTELQAKEELYEVVEQLLQDNQTVIIEPYNF